MLQLAFDIYGRLKKSGLELTLHSYHTALRGSAHLGAQGLQELYAQMRDRQDLQLKDKTFAYVFRGAANCGAAVPASWVIQVRVCSLRHPLSVRVYSLHHPCVHTGSSMHIT